MKNNTTNGISRREFISLSAVAGVAAVAGGVSLHAQAGQKSVAVVRVALLGCGARGTVLLEALHSLERVEVPVHVSVVADENTANLRTGIELETDWRACVTRPDIDAVVVALSDDLHAPAALAALAAGKHVYLETPFARTRDEAMALASMSTRGQGVLAVGAVECALPAWRLAETLVRDGRIGEPRWCHSVAPCALRAQNIGWRGERKRSQGIAAQRHFDQIAPLLMALQPGPARSATTAGGTWHAGSQTPDSLITAIRFDGDLTVNLVSSTANTTGQRPVIRGDQGCLEIFPDGVLLTPEHGDEQWITALPEELSPEEMLLADWVGAINNGREPLCTASLGLAAQEAVRLAVEAYERNGRVLQA